MAGIKNKNTRPELVLRQALHKRGFRYRLHVSGIRGRPDLVFPKHQALVFVHGCFWHRHPDCKDAAMPSTHQEFWRQKFNSNVARDAANQSVLLSQGWRLAVVWECTLRRSDFAVQAAELLAGWLTSKASVIEIGTDELTHSLTNADR